MGDRRAPASGRLASLDVARTPRTTSWYRASGTPFGRSPGDRRLATKSVGEQIAAPVRSLGGCSFAIEQKSSSAESRHQSVLLWNKLGGLGSDRRPHAEVPGIVPKRQSRPRQTTRRDCRK